MVESSWKIVGRGLDPESPPSSPRFALEGEERKRLDEGKHRQAKGPRWSGREEVSWSEVQKVKNSLPSA